MAFGSRLALMVGVAGALASCGNKSETKVGQSVARVDGYELTVHQLNGELRGGQQHSAKDEAAQKREALESLIDRRLLVAEAERNKLDRDPEVMQAIERQKGQVVIQALLQRKAANLSKPTAEEVQAYYKSNPALFANRKVYDMRQVTFAADSFTPELKELVDSGKTLDELAVWLDKKNVQFTKASASRSTADLPTQIVKSLDAVGSGRPFVIKDSARVMVASLHLTKETPVSEEEARPQIEQYLVNQKIRDVTSTEVARLRNAAKIEYLDPKVAPAAPDDSPALLPAAAGTKADDHISKGVSGLK